MDFKKFDQQETSKYDRRELCEDERNKKRSIEQLDQQILIKTKKIAELGRQEILKKKQLSEVMQKVQSQKRILLMLESQRQTTAEQDWNRRVAENNERSLSIEIAQMEAAERETARKKFELELELVKKSIAEGYSKLKKIHKQTKLVQNYRYNQQRVPIHLNQPTPSFNNPFDLEHCVPPPPTPQPFIPNQPIQSGLLPRTVPLAVPAQTSQQSMANSSTLTSSPTFNLDKSSLTKTDSKLDSSPATLSTVAKSLTFDNRIEIITIDDSDYDDDDNNVEEEEVDNFDDCETMLAKNIEDESLKSLDVNDIAVERSVLENKPFESTNDEIIVRFVPETFFNMSLELGEDFELVDNQNNTKLTSKTNNNNRKQHKSKSKRRDRSNSKLKNHKKKKRKESKKDKQQSLEQCREFYGMRKRKQEEEQHNSQASSELNRVGQNGKLRSNRDIDNRASGYGSKRWKLGPNETPEQRESRVAREREYDKQRRANETPEQREHRLELIREWGKQKRTYGTPEQRERHLAQMRECNRQRRANETPEQRERRLSQMRKRIANETSEDRKLRLVSEQERYQRRKTQTTIPPT